MRTSIVYYEVKIPPIPWLYPKSLCFYLQLSARNPPTQISLNLNKATEINLVPFITTKLYMAQSSPTNNHPKTRGLKNPSPKKLDQRLPTGTIFPFPFPRLERTDGPSRRSSNILVPLPVPYWPSSNWPWRTSPYRRESWPLWHKKGQGGERVWRMLEGWGRALIEKFVSQKCGVSWDWKVCLFGCFCKCFAFLSSRNFRVITLFSHNGSGKCVYVWNLKGKYYWRYTHFSLSPMIMAGKVNRHQLVQLCTNLHFFAFTDDIGGCQNPGSQWIATIYSFSKWSGKPFLTFTSSTGKPSV